MNRQIILKWLNPVVALLFLNQVITGLCHGSLSHGAFEILHEKGALALTLTVAGHLFLNGSWIKAQYFKKHPQA